MREPRGHRVSRVAVMHHHLRRDDMCHGAPPKTTTSTTILTRVTRTANRVFHWNAGGKLLSDDGSIRTEFLCHRSRAPGYFLPDRRSRLRERLFLGRSRTCNFREPLLWM